MNESDVVYRFEQGLERISRAYRAAFSESVTEQSLRVVNARFTGPQGELTGLLKLIPELPKEKRRHFGQLSNQLKDEILEAFRQRLESLARTALEAEMAGPHLDVTLPGRFHTPGRLHPLIRTKHELLDVFISFGFDVVEGPEVELHENNFDKLGFPPDHPATDMQDSFFIASSPADGPRKLLLRTHTSNVQIREMSRRRPPLAVVSPGMVYRRDDDVTHSPMFMQIEGFLVDRHVTFAQLKGVLTRAVQRLFGSDIPVRFRPSYFPFVEPGGEVDIGCWFCRGWDKRSTECRVCKGTSWLEILGCGMIHPFVFEQVGYDPEKYTGFAFGLGVDRVAMLRYGISDIRLLFENDPRFLTQF
ncbi:MAG: phenylalanine--tRNA ligase subunit alpha [Deltaproteobacteria bacterium]|nr:phenylalanine--tRNA ligase subunit alpha [Deltaproteobacteria bacterium]